MSSVEDSVPLNSLDPVYCATYNGPEFCTNEPLFLWKWNASTCTNGSSHAGILSCAATNTRLPSFVSTKVRFRRHKCPCSYYSNSMATFHLPLVEDSMYKLNPGPVTWIMLREIHGKQTMSSHTRESLAKDQTTSYSTHKLQKLLRHIDKLRMILKDKTPAFVAITETWLDSTVHNIEVDIGRYKVETLDHNRHCGRICLYIADRIKCKRRAELESRGFEILWIDVKTFLALGCIYKALNDNLGIFDHLHDIIREIRRSGKQKVILIGDFNCDYLNTSYHQTQRLNEFLNINHLKQLILTPTRITQTSSSLIDLIITTAPNLFNKSGTLSNSFNDHFPTNGVIKGKTNEHKHKLITTRK